MRSVTLPIVTAITPRPNFSGVFIIPAPVTNTPFTSQETERARGSLLFMLNTLVSRFFGTGETMQLVASPDQSTLYVLYDSRKHATATEYMLDSKRIDLLNKCNESSNDVLKTLGLKTQLMAQSNLGGTIPIGRQDFEPERKAVEAYNDNEQAYINALLADQKTPQYTLHVAFMKNENGVVGMMPYDPKTKNAAQHGPMRLIMKTFEKWVAEAQAQQDAARATLDGAEGP
ncbi:MAG: hypothetical protein U0003_02450 [Vampirovibrionales bacterium]